MSLSDTARNRDSEIAASSDPDSPEALEGTLMDGLENEPPYPSREQDAAQDRATRALADYAETLPWNTEAAFEASRLKLLAIVREVIGKVPRV